jgi:hypothetical protein
MKKNRLKRIHNNEVYFFDCVKELENTQNVFLKIQGEYVIVFEKTANAYSKFENKGKNKFFLSKEAVHNDFNKILKLQVSLNEIYKRLVDSGRRATMQYNRIKQCYRRKKNIDNEELEFYFLPSYK